MSEEVQRQLFTPFFTTKESGTGLGLATARKIIEAHRGIIRVTSEVGRGSTFAVALLMM
jgi:signal transduction histidine kinase